VCYKDYSGRNVRLLSESMIANEQQMSGTTEPARMWPIPGTIVMCNYWITCVRNVWLFAAVR